MTTPRTKNEVGLREVNDDDDDDDTELFEEDDDITTFCPEDGWNVKIDEDGLCVHCGATATGAAVDAMAEFLEDLGDSAHELCRSVLRVKDLIHTFELADEEELDDKPMADA